MSGINFMTRTLFALAIVTVGNVTTASAAEVDKNLRAELGRIAQRRIFFGHQSVGMNLLDGVNQLATMAGVPIRIDEVKTASTVESAMIGHAFIAENGSPFKKLKSFEQAMGAKSTNLDIALMKFCYVDFTEETNANELFERYRATLDVLRAKNPGTIFVHVTAPLTVVQGGTKDRLKQLFGKAPYGTLENMRREEYNALLRQAYKGYEPIFDLARVESSSPDGSVVSVKWKGRVIPVMFQDYSDDGGHLSATGKLLAARELISVLAAIPDRTKGDRLSR